jgi:hypothetical protein
MTYPGVDPALDPDRAAVEQRRKEREEEYGTYVAAQDIPWGNVLAFVAGDQVPKSTVEAYGWLDLGLVARTGTKSGNEAAGTATEPAKTNSGAKAAKGSEG